MVSCIDRMLVDMIDRMRRDDIWQISALGWSPDSVQKGIRCEEQRRSDQLCE